MPFRTSVRRLAVIAAVCVVSACEGLFGPADEGFVDLIVFAAGPDLQTSEVFTMRPDGSRVRQLTAGLKAFTPVWSPDGKTIAFVSGLPAPGVIYLMDAVGTNLRPLTAPRAGEHPTWSPDGAMIAYARGDTIFRIAVEGGNPEALLACVHPCGRPAWSPDGTRMAFVEWRPNGTTTLQPRLSVFSIDDPVPTEVSTGLVYEHNPTWTPDGSQIVFSGSPDHSQFQLYAATPDGTSATPVTASVESRYASWSSDGQRMAFTARRWTTAGFEDGIYIQDVGGGDPVRVYVAPVAYYISGLSWRQVPDGN